MQSSPQTATCHASALETRALQIQLESISQGDSGANNDNSNYAIFDH